MQRMFSNGYPEPPESAYGAIRARKAAETTQGDGGPEHMTVRIARARHAQKKTAHRFGRQLFVTLSAVHPELLRDCRSAFGFLLQAEARIAEQLPFRLRFEKDTLTLITGAKPALADLTEGLIHSCMTYFREEIDVRRYDSKGAATVFVLRKKVSS